MQLYPQAPFPDPVGHSFNCDQRTRLLVNMWRWFREHSRLTCSWASAGTILSKGPCSCLSDPQTEPALRYFSSPPFPSRGESRLLQRQVVENWKLNHFPSDCLERPG